MRSLFSLASAAATVLLAQAARFRDPEENTAPIVPLVPASTDSIQEGTIAPVVVLHGLNGDCNQIHAWVTDIATEIGDQAVVKCIEIGDGEATSIFERMEW